MKSTNDTSTIFNEIDNKINKISTPTTGNLVVQTSEGEIENVTKDTWHYVGTAGEPSFQNSWVNNASFQASRFKIDELGNVEIQGAIQSGTVGTVCFTLPAGYRPANRLPLISVDNSTTFAVNVYRIDIFSNGNVLVYGGNTYKSICVKFSVVV